MIDPNEFTDWLSGSSIGEALGRKMTVESHRVIDGKRRIMPSALTIRVLFAAIVVAIFLAIAAFNVALPVREIR